MRLPYWLIGLCALWFACGVPDESPQSELGVLTQAITDTFSGSLAQDEVAARGPFTVQPGSQLRVSITGTGDADLYVRFGSRPTLSNYACRPYEDGSNEQCVLTVPSNATNVFVDVRGYRTATYSLTIERDDGSGSGGGGSGGSGSGGSGSGGSGGAGGGSGGTGGATPITDTFSGSLARDEVTARGPFAIQPGSQLRVNITGTGDADLYVRFGSRPTLTSYDCRPYEDGSSEQCVLTVPSNATNVFVDVRGYRAATYTLTIQRVAGGGGSGGAGGSGSGGSGSGGTGSGGSGGTGGATSVTDTFSGSLARDEVTARGPFAVQPGSQLRATITGTGDADLYVRFGSRPTLSNYDCRPYEDGSSEQCVLTVPSNATNVFVDVRGYAAATYTLTIQRVTGSGGGGGGSGGGGSGPFVIAVLGSSTAEGEGASSAANSWVGLLYSALSATANVDVVNLAAGGYTSVEVLPGSGAFGSVDAAIDEQPDLIVMALAGSNDLSIGTSTSTYMARMAQVRDAARAAGIPTFFLSTAPKDLDDEERFLMADWGVRMGEAFNTCWVPANNAYSPCFIDIFGPLANSDLGIASQYNSGDGIHLNNAGHRVIFERVLPIVRSYMCTTTQCQ